VASSTRRRFVMMWSLEKPGSNEKSGRRPFRQIDQRPIIRPDCGGLENADAFYFDDATGCMRDCSLRIQATVSNPISHCPLRLIGGRVRRMWPLGPAHR
jgi:hypothetical protein